MQRLTIINVPGDPDALLVAKKEHMNPVMEDRAQAHGGIFHVAARGPDGMVIVNLWESEEGSEAAAQDPAIIQAQEAMRATGAASGPPQVTHYEVLEHMTPGKR